MSGKASYLWYAVLVDNLPNIPVFSPGSLPEFESGYKGIFIRQTLWEYTPEGEEVREKCNRFNNEEQKT